MGGDPGDRDVVLILLDPVLDADVARAGGVVRRELPAPCPQLEPREIPEHLRAEELVALLPLSMLAFEHRACLVDVAGVDKHPETRTFASRSRRGSPAAVARSRSRAAYARRLGVAHHAAEHVEVHECLEPEDVVVEARRRARVRHACPRGPPRIPPEAFRPGEADVDARLERRLRRRLAQGLLENGNGEVVVLELGEEEEGLCAQRAALRLGQQIVRRSLARASIRLQRDAHEPRRAPAGDARRARPAASGGARARRARPRTRTRRDRPRDARRRRARRAMPVSGNSVDSAR